MPLIEAGRAVSEISEENAKGGRQGPFNICSAQSHGSAYGDPSERDHTDLLVKAKKGVGEIFRQKMQSLFHPDTLFQVSKE